MEAILQRASIREFTAEPVEDKKIESILKAGMAAPTAGNQRPWEFYVVTAPTALERLGSATKYSGPAGKAPLCIVPCFKNKGMRHGDYVVQDMSACIENMLIEATHLGLGSLWMGIAPKEGRMEIIRNILTIPGHLSPFALVAIGYAAEKPADERVFEQDRIHYVRANYQTHCAYAEPNALWNS
ncbi:MAG: nitroreductase family protein [Coriobacteriia bacterium]|nr:nitroreductase family protein [Coriobacteriia bacterium]